MTDGAYPPGVTGTMIDELECAEPPETCETCMFYEERTCGYICSILEAGYEEKELKEMSDTEYMQKFGKKPDDRCKDYERWED